MAKVKLTLQLEGTPRSAFYLISAFRGAALHQGWKTIEIDKVIDECLSSDYEHLVKTLQDNCEDEGPEHIILN